MLNLHELNHCQQMQYHRMMRPMQLHSTTPEQTESIAARIGKNLRGGEVIELVSDLGGGKTTFTRGLAKGLDIVEVVSSPTFTISREYQTGRLVLRHYDFYRLHEPGLMSEEIAEAVADPSGVVIVEWADVVRDVLPANRLTIEITAKSENERLLTITHSPDLQYLLEGLA